MNDFKKRARMSRENRAKQFMPFAALTGHREVLKERERFTEERTELSDEMKEEINWKILRLTEGDEVSIRFYEEEAYHKVRGIVNAVSKGKRQVEISGRKICFDDIYSLDSDLFV